MNKLARKLVLSVLTVVLTVIALGTTTFAWFTLTNQAVVQPFNAQVIGDSGIQIAIGDVDGVLIETPNDLTWKAQLLATDITNYIEAKYGVTGGESNFRFNHVSTNGTQFNDMLYFYTIGENNHVHVPFEETVGEHPNGFLALPIHFRSADNTVIKWTEVILTSTPATKTNTFETFVDSKGNTVANGSSYTFNAADAFRIGIMNSTKSGFVPYDGGTPDIDFVVYENPVSATNTVLGNPGGVPLTTANGAMNFYNVMTSGGYPHGHEAVTTVATLTEMITEPTVLTMSGDNLSTAGAEYYGMVYVLIWLEGWDAEAFNFIFDEIVTVSLTFRGFES